MREDSRSSRTPASYNDCASATLLSVGGKAVEPAGATGGVERRLAAPLAHMDRIPRNVPAPGAVRVAEHGARTFCWEVRIRLRQAHAVRGPVVAGVIETVDVGPALG